MDISISGNQTISNNMHGIEHKAKKRRTNHTSMYTLHWSITRKNSSTDTDSSNAKRKWRNWKGNVVAAIEKMRERKKYYELFPHFPSSQSMHYQINSRRGEWKE